MKRILISGQAGRRFGIFPSLLLLFLAVPALELMLLIYLGEHLGFWPTVGLILSTGILGAWLARQEGLRVLRAVQQEFQEGRMPARQLLEGLMVLIAGAFLLTPGLLTDMTGFLLLIPAIRSLIVSRVSSSIAQRLRIDQPQVIDAEWRSEDEESSGLTQK